MNITENVLIAAITTVPALVSAVVALIASRITIWAENKKLEMAWTHEEKMQYEREFAEMLSSVKFLIDRKTSTELEDTIKKINIVRIKSTGSVASLLDNLYSEVAVTSITTADWWKIETRLANLVDARREQSKKQKHNQAYKFNQ